MKFALLSGRRVEAQPKLRAICPACSGEVIAKCGQQKWPDKFVQFG